MTLTIAMAIALPAAADVVVLKDGRHIEGRVKAQTADAVTVTSEGMDWTFAREKVESVSIDKAGAAREEKRENERKALFAAKVPKVFLYCTDRGWASRISKAFFHYLDVDIAVRDVLLDPPAMDELRVKCRTQKIRCNRLPIMEIGGKLRVGIDVDWVEHELKRQGVPVSGKIAELKRRVREEY